MLVAIRFVGYYSTMARKNQPLTVAKAAAKLKMSERYVRDICSRLDIGYLITDRLRLLSAEDLPKIRSAAKVKGRPKKDAAEE